jgi:phosphoenolpyruvate phosphomutase
MYTGCTQIGKVSSIRRDNRVLRGRFRKALALQMNRSVGGQMDTRASRLRRLIESPGLAFLMEAHNGLSARIVEEAGFDAIWAGGLALSASQGLRDCNEASWTQTLECIELMADAASLPILVDGDTGHGNFNNARRFVKKLEDRGVAGVCLEDKVFPKTNSFIDGEGQTLADCDEFCGRLKAAKDSVHDDSFVVVARTEALIAGRGLAEALKRAHAYWRAGADAILIHSARSDASEVLEFKRAWGATLPVLAVPTKYYGTPTETFREYGFSALIWANHLLRACIRAMQDTAARVFADQCLHHVEGAIAPLAEVFRLQRIDELREAERRYLVAAAPDGLQRIA